MPHQKTTKERGYGHDWRKFSELQREQRPFCEVCDARDKSTPADGLHHIEKIRDSPHKRLQVDNTVAVCNVCHGEIEGMDLLELTAFLERLRNEQ